MHAVILQRTVPHYRRALFSRLYDEFGWVVATDSGTTQHGLHDTGDTPPWLHRFPFKRSTRHQYRASVPIEAINRALAPEAFVAEFTPQMSSSWRLSADALLGRARGRKLAYWSQGWNVERGFSTPKDLAVQAIRLALLAPADAHLCYSSDGADFLRRRLPGKAPIFVASNTFDIDSLPGREIDTSPREPGSQHLLFVGRLTPDKKAPLLVRAVLEARRQSPGIRLTIIGDGPDMPAVIAAARGHGDAVEIRGPLYDDAALAPYFQTASLFVYAGSIGLAANHALAYGVPVVLFDDPASTPHHPEHRYVVDGVTGYRVAGTDENALAAQLLSLARQPIPAKVALRSALRRYVDENLTLDHMLSGFRQLDRFLAC